MFWEKFLSLCNSVDKSPNKVAAEIGIASGTITYWKQGGMPRWSVIDKLCEYFQVSREYFFQPDVKEEQNEDTPYINIDKIKDLAKEKGLSITFICQAVGQGPYYLNDVKRRNGSIPEERLKTIADTLGTTVEYLTDQTEQKEKPAETEVDLDKLMEDILNLPRDKKEKLAVLFMEMLKNTK